MDATPGLPLLLALMTAACYTLAGGPGFAGPQVGPLVGLVPQLLWTLVLGGPLEEELGWRGFAFPLLRARTNALVSSLIIGMLWGFWHLPLFLLPGTSQYVLVTQHPPGILRFVGFVVQTTALSILFGWLVTRTGTSVPIAMVFHTAANMAWRTWQEKERLKLKKSRTIKLYKEGYIDEEEFQG